MWRIVVILVGLVLIGLAVLFLHSGGQGGICTVEISETAPSGRLLSLCDVVYEQQPNGSIWAVVRVLDPGLADGASGQTDHDWACETWGLAASDVEPHASRIVIQIMAEPFVRGEPAPGVRQAIEVYSDSGGTCRWELF